MEFQAALSSSSGYHREAPSEAMEDKVPTYDGDGRDGTGLRRVALYLRVSTGAQASRDLSIPDQRQQLRDYCKARGWKVVAEYKDARTGTDANRPGFTKLMNDAGETPASFDVILVHSFSRFFRDEIEFELRARSLKKRKIRLISVTQEFNDDSNGDMVRRIMAIFDEYDSKETAKHVSRAMAENARQGFFNGGVPPFGYEAVEAERRGTTSKKKLVPFAAQADVVRLIFELYLKGDGTSGPLGVKKVTEWLNDHGYRTRRGSRWGIGAVHKLLQDETYKGSYWHNRSRDAESILVPVPAIVSAEIFDAAQRKLTMQNPKQTPPRIVSGPTLLAGLATCASCGSGMLISTGKSGRYRYYACGGRVRQGKGTCAGRRVRMSEMDDLVLNTVLGSLLTYERMEKLLAALRKRQTARDEEKTARLAGYRKKLDDAETRWRRLIEAIENGILDASDPDLKERVETVRNERDLAKKAVDTALAELEPTAKLTKQKVFAFIDLMRKNLTEGDIQFRRAYLRAIIDNIEMDDATIRIYGRKRNCEVSAFKRRNSKRRDTQAA